MTMNLRRALFALAGLGLVTALAFLLSGHSESRQWPIVRVPAEKSADAEKRLTAWLAEKGFKPVPAARHIGPSQVCYEGPAAGTRRPISVVLYKTPELNCDVLWTFEGHDLFFKEDRSKAQGFVLALKSWCAAYVGDPE